VGRRGRPGDANSAVFRQSVLALLEANGPGEDTLLDSFEKLRSQGHAVYSAALFILSHLSFSESEARRHWRRILAHRSLLGMTLHRDVGLRVAMLDYFVNVNRALDNPKVIELSVYERTERSALTDGLTGLYNHAYFVGALKREVQRARRAGTRVSLAMFDLDNFKRINDSRGHLEGDRVLARTAALVREGLREADVAARYGGEEFAVVLPDTPRTGAFVVAERTRRRVEERVGRRRSGQSVTVSGGVASFPDDAAGPEELVQRADQALYRSKADGKNRITLAEGERRRHLRVPVSHRVYVDGRVPHRLAARARNVSESGLLVSLDEPLPVGAAVSLEIRPAGSSKVGVRGEVVRVSPSPGQQPGLYDLGVRVHGDGARALLMLSRPGGVPTS